MKEFINIAIDGPSSAGKSTLAKEVAKELNIAYLDTGAMYRSLAYYILQKNIDINDENKVKEYLNEVNFTIKKNGNGFILLLNNEDLSNKIRENKISMAASNISKFLSVRKKLVEIQKEIAKNNDVVLDGRDTTSVILKDSKFKFYLDASVEKRAIRRYEELKQKGEKITFEEVCEDIKKRDLNDKTRKNSPLIRTEDSFYIDNSNLTKDETLKILIDKVKEIRGR